MAGFQERLVHKRGSTFVCNGQYFASDGVTPVDLTAAGIVVSSAVVSEDSGERFELTVQLLDQGTNPGEFLITGETDEWLADSIMLWDILYTQGAIDWASATQRILMLEQVT